MILGFGDGRWSDRDRAVAVALLRYEASLCSGCSLNVSEWDSGGSYGVTEKVCPGCAALESNKPENPKPGAKYILSGGESVDISAETDVPDYITG